MAHTETPKQKMDSAVIDLVQSKRFLKTIGSTKSRSRIKRDVAQVLSRARRNSITGDDTLIEDILDAAGATVDDVDLTKLKSALSKTLDEPALFEGGATAEFVELLKGGVSYPKTTMYDESFRPIVEELAPVPDDFDSVPVPPSEAEAVQMGWIPASVDSKGMTHYRKPIEPEATADTSTDEGLKSVLATIFSAETVEKNFAAFKTIYETFKARAARVTEDMLKFDPLDVFRLLRICLDGFWSQCKKVFYGFIQTLNVGIRRSIEVITEYFEKMKTYVLEHVKDGVDSIRDYLGRSFSWLTSWMSSSDSGALAGGSDCPACGFDATQDRGLLKGGVGELFNFWDQWFESYEDPPEPVEIPKTMEGDSPAWKFVKKVFSFLWQITVSLWDTAKAASLKLYNMIEYAVREAVTINIIAVGVMWTIDEVCTNVSVYLAETYNWAPRTASNEGETRSLVSRLMAKVSSAFTLLSGNLSVGDAIVSGLSSVASMLPSAGLAVANFFGIGPVVGSIFTVVGKIFETMVVKSADRLSTQLDQVFSISSRVVLVRQNFEIMWNILCIMLSGCSYSIPDHLVARTALVGENLLGFNIRDPRKIRRLKECSKGPIQCELDGLNETLVMLNKNKQDTLNSIQSLQASVASGLAGLTFATGPYGSLTPTQAAELAKLQSTLKDQLATIKIIEDRIKELVEKVQNEIKQEIEDKRAEAPTPAATAVPTPMPPKAAPSSVVFRAGPPAEPTRAPTALYDSLMPAPSPDGSAFASLAQEVLAAPLSETEDILASESTQIPLMDPSAWGIRQRYQRGYKVRSTGERIPGQVATEYFGEAGATRIEIPTAGTMIDRGPVRLL